MKKRFEEIQHSLGQDPIQMGLFSFEDHVESGPKYPNLLPEIRKSANDVLELIRNSSDCYLGLDFEFRNDRITIVGVANEHVAASCYWQDRIGYELISGGLNKGIKYVGFSTIGAEKRELEKFAKKELPLEMFEDAMILFWQMNSDLCKLDQGKEKGEKGSLGFMNLWACCSLNTMLPMWKQHRGLTCSGPCPLCDALSYNSVDTWGALISFLEMRKLIVST